MELRIKCYLLLSTATTFWLIALYPVHDLLKILAYFISLSSSWQLIQASRQLTRQTARAIAVSAIQQELEKQEIALHYEKQQNRLNHLYSSPQEPEAIRQEIIDSLEELVQESDAERSTSLQERKALYRAIEALLEVKPYTYILEEVLHLSGGQWNKGKDFLEHLLQQGREEEW